MSKLLSTLSESDLEATIVYAVQLRIMTITEMSRAEVCNHLKATWLSFTAKHPQLGIFTEGSNRANYKSVNVH